VASEPKTKTETRLTRTPDIPRVVAFKRACDLSGYSYTTLRDAHFRGDLAIVRVGRSWYVSEAELHRFTQANTVVRHTA
jgi:hypothetical protein